MHENIWPALVEEYEQMGVRQVSCFIKGCDLYVYSEYEDRDDIDTSRPSEIVLVDDEWQRCMDLLMEKPQHFIHPDEIFHMSL